MGVSQKIATLFLLFGLAAPCVHGDVEHSHRELVICVDLDRTQHTPIHDDCDAELHAHCVDLLAFSSPAVSRPMAPVALTWGQPLDGRARIAALTPFRAIPVRPQAALLSSSIVLRI